MIIRNLSAIVLFLLLMVICPGTLYCQDKYITKSGEVWFVSHTDLLDIEGYNNEMGSIADFGTGDVVFIVVMTKFDFKLPLAEEHFNENYIESDKYPKAVFAGKILDHDKEDLTQEGKYEVEVEGDMTLHGCTRRICEKGILEVTDGKITGTSKFKIALKDYKIKIPRLVDEKVAEVIDVAVKVEYEAYRKGSGQ